jgi:Flp pilus assembly protein TadG
MATSSMPDGRQRYNSTCAGLLPWFALNVMILQEMSRDARAVRGDLPSMLITRTPISRRLNDYLIENAKATRQHMTRWATLPMLRFVNHLGSPRRRRSVLLPRSLQTFARLMSRGGLCRCSVNQSGETMMEFALVAPLLILLMLTIIDLGIMLTSQAVLNGAAEYAGRLVRTGQLQDHKYTCQGSSTAVAGFQCALCTQMGPVMSYSNCTSQVLFEVNCWTTQSTSTQGCTTGNTSGFGAVSFSSCTYNPNATGTGTQCNMDPGSSTDIVAIRVIYNRSFIVPWVGRCLTLGQCWMGLGTRQGTGTPTSVPLTSTQVFQNEPFPAT